MKGIIGIEIIFKVFWPKQYAGYFEVLFLFQTHRNYKYNIEIKKKADQCQKKKKADKATEEKQNSKSD